MNSMKKSDIKEYGIRKLNSIINFGDLIIITETPTIADDDCYIDVEDAIEYILLNEYKSLELIQGVYIHHYTDNEEYIATYKFRPTQKDMAELEMLYDRVNWNGIDEDEEDGCICLGEGVEYEEGNQESLLNALEQLMKNIEKAERLSRQNNK